MCCGFDRFYATNALILRALKSGHPVVSDVSANFSATFDVEVAVHLQAHVVYLVCLVMRRVLVRYERYERHVVVWWCSVMV